MTYYPIDELITCDLSKTAVILTHFLNSIPYSYGLGDRFLMRLKSANVLVVKINTYSVL